MKKLKTVLFIILGLLVGFAPAWADVRTEEPSEDYHYVFSLDYKAGKTAVQKIAYVIMTGPRAPVIEGAYLITVKNRVGKNLVAVDFDAAAMADQNGIVRVAVPYQPSGTVATVTGPNGGLIDQVDLSLSSTCNDDKVCDASVGEDGYNCPSDCPKPAPVASVSPQASPSVSNPPRTTSSPANKRWGLILLALIAGSGAAGVGLLLHRYRSGRQ